MPELILLAVVSLAAMGMMVFLFLKLTTQQTKLIEFLSQSNQSLLNQVRTTDVAALSGLMYATGQAQEINDAYISTDDREMAAYVEALAQQHSLGEEILDDDLETFRSAL